jgi:hypothetical protein
MLRPILIYGIIAGLIVIVPFAWLANSDSPETILEGGMMFGYLMMIIALTAVFLGIKHYRDKVLGGAIRFGPALLVGLGISAVAGVVYVLGWETAMAVSDFDFAGAYAKSMVDAARENGAAQAELQKVIADAESFRHSYANPMFRLPMTFIEIFPVGVLISLVSAALLRNSRLLPARQA